MQQGLFGDGLIKVKKLHPKARIPEYKTIGSVGADLYTIEEQVVPPLAVSKISTGLSIEIPTGFEGQIRPRSGLAAKNINYDIPNSPGTIDSDYRGELCILIRNLTDHPLLITEGMRIAQLVICPVYQNKFIEVSDLEETKRGMGGFGSTGV